MVNSRYTRMRKRFLDTILLTAALTVLGWTGAGRAAPPEGASPQRKTKKAATNPSKPAEKKATAMPSFRPVEGSLRDPFKLPPALPETNTLQGNDLAMQGPLPPGSRGLIIDQLKLEGIVRQGKENPKMIAVLANSANRAFFLHENDPLYNGIITKITPDSVYFREDVRDAAGKTSSREVIKKLAPAPGEKK